jgi:hypothetical protein
MWRRGIKEAHMPVPAHRLTLHSIGLRVVKQLLIS